MSRTDLLKLHQRLKRPLILDGALGSNLQEFIQFDGDDLWSSRINLEKPDEVIDLHKKYIKAGADIITTNTFRTNPIGFRTAKLKITNEEFVKLSVEIALEARGNKDIIIAGSNAPAEDCYQKERTITKAELKNNHIEHIGYLWKHGCDIIWNETISHFDEIEIICEYCSSNNIPYTLNLFFNKELKLLSGEKLEEVIEFVKPYNPSAIGFNCINRNLLKKLFEYHQVDYRWGFYLNCGSGNFNDEEITCAESPSEYWNEVEKYLKYSPLYIGSCCGSNPSHTKFIKEKINEIYSD